MSITFFNRLIAYTFIWILYLVFMSNYAPLGVDWLTWHSARISNFVEFLKSNHYLKHYGFSVWSKCTECDLSDIELFNGIYVSTHSISYIFYVIIYLIFEKKNFIFIASTIDKIIILLTGILTSEIANNLFIKKKNYLFLLPFIFFISNPWTYKMILAPWVQLNFLLFVLLSFFLFLKNRITLGMFFFFIAGLFDYQSAAGLGVYFSLLYLILSIHKNSIKNNYYFIVTPKKYVKNIIFLSFIPLFFFLTLKILLSLKVGTIAGSDLLSRIGISGNDLNNGGLLGSLQFLGGNRISICISENLETLTLSKKIFIYNCLLTTSSMILISLLSIVGLFFLFKLEKLKFKKVIFPILFLILSYICILQQSLSVHLMGYSYIFSFLFSLGLLGLTLHSLNKFKSKLSLIFLLPIIMGLTILMIRVNMLTGING